MKNGQRALAGALSVVLFSTQVLFAHVPETSLWESRRQTTRATATTLARLPDAATPPLKNFSFNQSALSIPNLAGLPPATVDTIAGATAAIGAAATVQEILVPKKTGPMPVVLFLQDIHGLADAQRNLAAALGRVHDWRADTVIGVEGADGDIDATPFRGPRAADNRFAATFLLNGGEIAGPEYAALTSASPLLLFGLEDKSLYLANVAAVRAAWPQRNALGAAAKEDRRRIEVAAEAAFTPEMRAFARLSDDYAARRRSLPDFLSSVSRLPQYVAADYPELARFLNALTLEKSLNAAAAERERGELLSRICSVLSKEKLETLMSAGIAVRAGTLSHAAFCRLLEEDARDANATLTSYPNFRSYLAYVAAADGLRPERILAEADQAQNWIWSALCRTDEQRRLVTERRRALLTEKLVSLSLTTPEWAAYKATRTGNPALAPFEAFYAAAESRNAAIADRLLSRLPTGKNRTAVLVAGGFHKEGLCRRLVEKGVAVVVLTPKLKNPGAADSEDYLSVFTRGRTPLSEIFDSPSITLANTLALKPISKEIRTGADVKQLLPELRAVHAVRDAVRLDGNAANLPVRRGQILIGDPAAQEATNEAGITVAGDLAMVTFAKPSPHMITLEPSNRPASETGPMMMEVVVENDRVVVRSVPYNPKKRFWPTPGNSTKAQVNVNRAPRDGDSLRDVVAFICEQVVDGKFRWHTFGIVNSAVEQFPVFSPRDGKPFYYHREHKLSYTIRHFLWLPPTFEATAVALLTTWLDFTTWILDTETLEAGRAELTKAVDKANRVDERLRGLGLAEQEISDLKTYANEFITRNHDTILRDRDALLRDLADPNVIAFTLAPEAIELDWAQRLRLTMETWRKENLRPFSVYHRDFLNNLPLDLRLKLFTPKFLTADRSAALRDFLSAPRAGVPAVDLSKGFEIIDVTDASSGRGHPTKGPVYRIELRAGNQTVRVYLKTYLKDALGQSTLSERSRYEPLFFDAARAVGLPSTFVRFHAETADPKLGGFILMDEIPGVPLNRIIAKDSRDQGLTPEASNHAEALVAGLARWAALSDALISADRPAVPFVFPQNPTNFLVRLEALQRNDPAAVTSVDHEYLFNASDTNLLDYIARYGASEMGMILAMSGSNTTAGFRENAAKYEAAYRAEWENIRRRQVDVEKIIAATFGPESEQLARFRASMNVDPAVRLSRQQTALLLFAANAPRFVEMATEMLGTTFGERTALITPEDAWFHKHWLITGALAPSEQTSSLTTEDTYRDWAAYPKWFVEIFIAPWAEASETFRPARFRDAHHDASLWAATTRDFGVIFILLGMVTAPLIIGYALAAMLGVSQPQIYGLALAAVSVIAGAIRNSTEFGVMHRRSALALIRRADGRVESRTGMAPDATDPIDTVLLALASPSYLGSGITHFLYNLASNVTRILGKARWAPLVIDTSAPDWPKVLAHARRVNVKAPRDGDSLRDVLAFVRELIMGRNGEWHTFSILPMTELDHFPVFAPRDGKPYYFPHQHRMTGSIRHTLYLPTSVPVAAVPILEVFLEYVGAALNAETRSMVESELRTAKEKAERVRAKMRALGLTDGEIATLRIYADRFIFDHRESLRDDRDALLRDLADPDILNIALSPHPIEMDWAQSLRFPFEEWRTRWLRPFSTYHRDFVNNLPTDIRLKLFRAKILTPSRQAALREFFAAQDPLSSKAADIALTITNVVDASSGRGHPNKGPVYRLSLLRDGRPLTVYLKTYLRDAPGRNVIALRSQYEPVFFGAAAAVSLPSTFVRYFPEDMDPGLGGFVLMKEIDGVPLNAVVQGKGTDKRLRPAYAAHADAFIEGMARWAALSDALVSADRPAVPFMFDKNPANFIVDAERLLKDDPAAIVSVDHEYLFNETDRNLLDYIVKYGASEIGTLLALDGSDTAEGFTALAVTYERAYRAQWVLVVQNRSAIEKIVASTFAKNSEQVKRFRASIAVDPSVRLSRQQTALLLFAAGIQRFSAMAREILAASLQERKKYVNADDAWFNDNPLVVQLESRGSTSLTTEDTYRDWSAYPAWFVEMFIAPWYEATDTFEPIGFLALHSFSSPWSFLSRALGTLAIVIGMVLVPIAAGHGLATVLGFTAPVAAGVALALVSILSGRLIYEAEYGKRMAVWGRILFGTLASPAYTASAVTHFLYNVVSNVTRVFGRARVAPLARQRPRPSFTDQRDAFAGNLRRFESGQRYRSLSSVLHTARFQGLPEEAIHFLGTLPDSVLGNPEVRQEAARLYLEAAELAIVQDDRQLARGHLRQALDLAGRTSLRTVILRREDQLADWPRPDLTGERGTTLIQVTNRESGFDMRLDAAAFGHIESRHREIAQNASMEGHVSLFPADLDSTGLLALLRDALENGGSIQEANPLSGRNELIYYPPAEDAARYGVRRLIIVTDANGAVATAFPTAGDRCRFYAYGHLVSDENANMIPTGGFYWNRGSGRPLAVQWGTKTWGLQSVIDSEDVSLRGVAPLDRERLVWVALREANLGSETATTHFFRFEPGRTAWKEKIGNAPVVLTANRDSFLFEKIYRGKAVKKSAGGTWFTNRWYAVGLAWIVELSFAIGIASLLPVGTPAILSALVAAAVFYVPHLVIRSWIQKESGVALDRNILLITALTFAAALYVFSVGLADPSAQIVLFVLAVFHLAVNIRANLGESFRLTKEERESFVADGQGLADFLGDRSLTLPGHDREPVTDPFVANPDFMMVFGLGNEILGESAADLFVEGLKRNPKLKIIFAGGKGRATPPVWRIANRSEADGLSTAFLKRIREIDPRLEATARTAMILEVNSENSGQNVVFTRETLKTLHLAPTSILLIHNPLFQLRSALATYLKQSGLNIPTTSFPPFRVDMKKLTDAQLYAAVRFMTGEIHRLRTYPLEDKEWTVPVALTSVEPAEARLILTAQKVEKRYPKNRLPDPDVVIGQDRDFGRTESKEVWTPPVEETFLELVQRRLPADFRNGWSVPNHQYDEQKKYVLSDHLQNMLNVLNYPGARSNIPPSVLQFLTNPGKRRFLEEFILLHDVAKRYLPAEFWTVDGQTRAYYPGHEEQSSLEVRRNDLLDVADRGLLAEVIRLHGQFQDFMLTEMTPDAIKIFMRKIDPAEDRDAVFRALIATAFLDTYGTDHPKGNLSAQVRRANEVFEALAVAARTTRTVMDLVREQLPAEYQDRWNVPNHQFDANSKISLTDHLQEMLDVLNNPDKYPEIPASIRGKLKDPANRAFLERFILIHDVSKRVMEPQFKTTRPGVRASYPGHEERSTEMIRSDARLLAGVSDAEELLETVRLHGAIYQLSKPGVPSVEAFQNFVRGIDGDVEAVLDRLAMVGFLDALGSLRAEGNWAPVQNNFVAGLKQYRTTTPVRATSPSSARPRAGVSWAGSPAGVPPNVVMRARQLFAETPPPLSASGQEVRRMLDHYGRAADLLSAAERGLCHRHAVHRSSVWSARAHRHGWKFPSLWPICQIPAHGRRGDRRRLQP